MMTDELPQMIPNMVRKLRILLARKVATVWRNVSRKFMASLTKTLYGVGLSSRPEQLLREAKQLRSGETCFLSWSLPAPQTLLQYHLIVLLQRVVNQLRFRPVRNPNLDRNLPLKIGR